jgi:hypothetical protein
MPKKTSKPGDIHLKIVEVLKRFPEGISGGQIRQELEKEGLRAEDQTHLDRRKRDLKKCFVIQKENAIQEIGGKKRPVVLYRYEKKNNRYGSWTGRHKNQGRSHSRGSQPLSDLRWDRSKAWCYACRGSQETT